MDDWIKFDIEKVLELKDTYCEVMEFVQQDVFFNLNSVNQIKNYFDQQFNIILPNTKIATFQTIMNVFNGFDSPLYLISEQIIVYLKAKYTIKNYISYILDHENDGIITLRNTNGKLTLGRQPLSYNDEIKQCIISQSKEAAKQTPDYMK